MTKNVWIDIKSVQEVNGERSVVELSTAADFSLDDDCCTIVYNEGEESGMRGSVTTLKICGGESVVLSRRGEYNSQMIIEKGARHLCHYETPYGGIMMGVSAEYISSALTERGGKLSFKYDVDINSSLATRNEIFIRVKESMKSNVEDC